MLWLWRRGEKEGCKGMGEGGGWAAGWLPQRISACRGRGREKCLKVGGSSAGMQAGVERARHRRCCRRCRSSSSSCCCTSPCSPPPCLSVLAAPAPPQHAFTGHIALVQRCSSSCAPTTPGLCAPVVGNDILVAHCSAGHYGGAAAGHAARCSDSDATLQGAGPGGTNGIRQDSPPTLWVCPHFTGVGEKQRMRLPSPLRVCRRGERSRGGNGCIPTQA